MSLEKASQLCREMDLILMKKLVEPEEKAVRPSPVDKLAQTIITNKAKSAVLKLTKNKGA